MSRSEHLDEQGPDRQPVGELDVLLEGARDAAERWMPTLARLDEGALRGASTLPGWNRAHVLAHLARNADALLRVIEGAASNRPAVMYPGGREGRDREIVESAQEPLEVLLEDVRTSQARLEAAWAETPSVAWTREVELPRGRHPAWRTVWNRWRELDIHHLDVDMGMTPAEWPAEFVDRALGELAPGVDARLPADQAVTLLDEDGVLVHRGRDAAVEVVGPRHLLVAWLTGRAHHETPRARTAAGEPASLPTLPPWA